MFFGGIDLIFWKMEDFSLATASLYFPPFFLPGLGVTGSGLFLSFSSDLMLILYSLFLPQADMDSPEGNATPKPSHQSHTHHQLPGGHSGGQPQAPCHAAAPMPGFRQ